MAQSSFRDYSNEAEDRMIAQLDRKAEVEAMLVQQDGFLYPNYQSDWLYDREVESHQTGPGSWSF